MADSISKTEKPLGLKCGYYLTLMDSFLAIDNLYGTSVFTIIY